MKALTTFFLSLIILALPSTGSSSQQIEIALTSTDSIQTFLKEKDHCRSEIFSNSGIQAEILTGGRIISIRGHYTVRETMAALAYSKFTNNYALTITMQRAEASESPPVYKVECRSKDYRY